VEQDPGSYHILVHYFMMNGEPYRSILHTLTGEYVTQLRGSNSSRGNWKQRTL
jgi:hypothetical protein